MPFHAIDAILGGMALTFSFLVAFAGAWAAFHAASGAPSFASLIALGVFATLVVLTTGVVGRVVHAWYPLVPGRFRLATPNRVANVWKLLGFLNLFNLSLLIHTYACPVTLRGVLYRFFGTGAGHNIMIGGKIIEPWMVSLGNFVILGEDSLVLGHVIRGDEVVLGRVRIGNNVTVGVKAVVMPDVEIGDRAIVWAGAVVPMGSRIGPGEEWAGIPARCVRRAQVGD